LAGGSHHQHYYFEVTHHSGTTHALVARIPFSDGEGMGRRMLVEHRLLQFLHQQGYDWMPDSLYHGFTGNGQSTPSRQSRPSVPFSIQTYIAGTRPRRLSKRQAAELARMAATLHSLKVSSALAAMLPVYQTWQDYAQALLTAMQQWFERLTREGPPTALVDLLPPVERVVQKVSAVVQARPACMRAATDRQYIVHGDIGRHNLLLAGGSEGDERQRLYLLDWEFAGSGDPAFDIAVTFQSPRLKKQWRTVFTSTYSTLMSGNSFENFWQRVTFYEPIVTGHTVLWALGQLFKAWVNQDGTPSFSHIAWYARILRHRLSLIDQEAGQQVGVLLERLLGERFLGSS
jgi:thiamine kinase-like enzyme